MSLSRSDASPFYTGSILTFDHGVWSGSVVEECVDCKVDGKVERLPKAQPVP